MKKTCRKRKSENFAQWVERVAAACQGSSLEEVHDMIMDVCKTSYLAGIEDGRKIHMK